MHGRRIAALLLTAAGISLGGAAGAQAAAPVFSQYTLPQLSSSPIGVEPGPDGAMWVTEPGVNKIARVTTSGTMTQFSIPTASASPDGIGAGPDGNLWFAEKGANKIGRITTAGVFTEFTIPTTNSQPVDIVAGPDGNMWFSESNTGKIGRITTAGVITEFSTSSSTSQPEGVKAGPDGNIWFAETGANKIGRLTPTGTLTEFSAVTGSDPSPGPIDIIQGPDGAMWFTASNGNRIGRITTSGTVTDFAIPTASSSTVALASGPDGNVWFTESAGNKIGQITPAGVVTEYTVPTAASSPYDIVTGTDGRLWFAEAGGNAVGAAALAPAATTGSAAAITEAGATLNATVVPNGQTVSVHFEYGTTAFYGSSTASQSVSGSGSQPAAAAIGGLAASTTYHFRVVSTSAGGTAYGVDQTFTTADPPPSSTSTPTDTSTPTGDATTAPKTDTSVPPPNDPTAPLVPAIDVKSIVEVGSSGAVPVGVSCPATATGDCRGTMTLTLIGRAAKTKAKTVVAARCGRGCRPLGSTHYEVRRGGHRNVRVRLSKSAVRLLNRRRRLPAQLTITSMQGGKASTKHRRIVLERRVARVRRKGGR